MQHTKFPDQWIWNTGVDENLNNRAKLRAIKKSEMESILFFSFLSPHKEYFIFWVLQLIIHHTLIKVNNNN